jgi:hypothetical protein
MFRQYTALPLLWLACVGMAESGEIIISPVAKDKIISPAVNDRKRPDEAAVLRNKAQTYQSGNVQSMPSSDVPIIIQMDAEPGLEEGVLLPRSDGIPAASRTKNHESFRDNIPAMQDAQSSGNGAASAGKQDARIQLEKNRDKASQYMKGQPVPSLVSANKDSQVVACDSIGSTSGRIGDDSMSGREIIVIRDGKQLKMRCK